MIFHCLKLGNWTKAILTWTTLHKTIAIAFQIGSDIVDPFIVNFSSLKIFEYIYFYFEFDKMSFFPALGQNNECPFQICSFIWTSITWNFDFEMATYIKKVLKKPDLRQFFLANLITSSLRIYHSRIHLCSITDSLNLRHNYSEAVAFQDVYGKGTNLSSFFV